MLGLDFIVILKKAHCMFIWTILKFRGKSTPPIWRPEVMWRHVWSREWKRSTDMCVYEHTWARSTDNFNGYLALSNFSNFTTNTHGTPNTRFFHGYNGTDCSTPITRFFTFQFWKTPITHFFLPKFEKKNMKKRVFGVPCVFVVKLEKLDNAKYPLKLSVSYRPRIIL